MTRKGLWIALCALFLCGSAVAAEHPLDEAFERCHSEDPSTAGVVQCAEEFAEKWDQELNRAYKELMGLLPKEGQSALRTAQRAWIPWRDSEHALAGAYYETLSEKSGGGTIWSMSHAVNSLEPTRGRTLELIAYVDELKRGKPRFEGSYPAKQTDEQLAEAMKVKNLSSKLGKGLVGDGAKTASVALKAWEEFRNGEAQFLAQLYGKKSDAAFLRHVRMVKNMERSKRFDQMIGELEEVAGGAEEQETKGAGETERAPEPEGRTKAPEAERAPAAQNMETRTTHEAQRTQEAEETEEAGQDDPWGK
ncbi:MAG TPA: hypothetical protein DIC53_04390 [Synergistaceae bacterium]|nr:hypothetical protein [Synergistaceae bacterium]